LYIRGANITKGQYIRHLDANVNISQGLDVQRKCGNVTGTASYVNTYSL